MQITPDGKDVFKSIPGAVKSALTRAYTKNAGSTQALALVRDLCGYSDAGTVLTSMF